MSRSTTLFAGLFGTFAVSAYLMVLVPQAQLGGLQSNYKEDEGKFTEIYPIKNLALDEGRSVYVREGCIYCHTQQIRDEQNGTDLSRGWGVRRTVARDYIYDWPIVLGNLRLGPDLANVGSPDWRDEPKDDSQKPAKRDAAWHLLHLYSPRTIVRDSNHPPYRYLFDKIKISGEKSADALDLSGDDAPKAGYQIVPSSAAKTLVAYLLALDHSTPLKEAAAPSSGAPATPAPAAAPAAGAAPATAAPAK